MRNFLETRQTTAGKTHVNKLACEIWSCFDNVQFSQKLNVRILPSRLHLNKIFFSNYKMVIVTLTTIKNPHTVYFDQPIQKPSYIWLLSCSLYNSWSSLEKDGIIFFKQVDKLEETHYLRMGNYSLDDIGDIFEKGFPEKDLFTVEKGITGRSLIIKAKEPKIKKFGLNKSLLNFFNLAGYKNSASIEKDYFDQIIIDSVSNPKNYFINCDLIDKQQSLLNGKPSSLLACFDIRGKPYEKIHYQNTHLNVLREVSTGYHVTHTTLSVTDENGLLNLNGWPLQFQIEIN